MTKVKFKGWKYGMQKVAFTKLLRNEANLPLEVAKQTTNDLLESKTITIELLTLEEARNIYEKAESLGVVSEIVE